MSQRQRNSIVIIGKRGQGKSSYLAKMFKELLSKGYPKILILISNDPVPYNWVERIHGEDQLKSFCHGSGIAKYYPDSDSPRKEEETLLLLRDHFRNGILVIEDATAWLPSNLPRAAREWVINYKNYGVDLFTTYHSLKLPPFLAEYVTHVTLFKTQNNLDRSPGKYEGKFESYYEVIYEAWKKVNSLPDEKGYIQPHVTIETGI